MYGNHTYYSPLSCLASPCAISPQQVNPWGVASYPVNPFLFRTSPMPQAAFPVALTQGQALLGHVIQQNIVPAVLQAAQFAAQTMVNCTIRAAQEIVTQELYRNPQFAGLSGLVPQAFPLPYLQTQFGPSQQFHAPGLIPQPTVH
jgi:hypothetical protein